MLFYTIIFLHICTVYNQHPFLGLVFNTLVVQHSQHDLLPFRPPCDVAPPPSRDSNWGRAVRTLPSAAFFFLSFLEAFTGKILGPTEFRTVGILTISQLIFELTH